MAKFQSPLLGYNNNVRHRGRVFHIQTEDSGVNHPHIITHLFMDGGRILKSVKKSYAEHVGTDNMNEVVRAMMKEQHKAMFVALRDGQFDEVALGKKPSGPIAPPAVPPQAAAAPPAAPKPAASAAPATTGTPPAREPTEPSLPAVPAAPVAPVALKEAPVVAVVKVSSEAVPVPPASRTKPDPRPTGEIAPATVNERHHDIDFGADPPLPPELEALLRDELPLLEPPVAVASSDAEPATAREPSQQRPALELTLDFDALERDSDVGESPLFQQQGLPPPPKNLFAKEPGTGTYKAREADHTPAPRILPSPAPPQARPASTTPPRASQRTPPASPATSFRATPPKPPPSTSLFSDDLVSDKSLDEVILSYLAEELDPPQQK